MFSFLEQLKVQRVISEFCSTAAFQFHFRCIVGDVKLTYEEAYTILTQIEGCLNSLPLVYTGNSTEDGLEVLTPGHFLIGQPLMSLPDSAMAF